MLSRLVCVVACAGVEIDFAPSCRSQGLLDSFCVAKVLITAQTVQPQLHMRFASALEAKLHSQERTAVLKHCGTSRH
jgi:hypothetical protein